MLPSWLTRPDESWPGGKLMHTHVPAKLRKLFDQRFPRWGFFLDSSALPGYTVSILWHERQRYLPGILAVAFSALLIAVQCGLLLGMFTITSIPVDHTRADVWVG